MDTSHALIDILLMFAAAKAGGFLLARLRQPPVIGELLAGVIIGPGVLNWLRPAEFHEILAELGVVFLLFSVGLETHVGSLKAVGRVALLAALMGVALPFIGGAVLIKALGGPTPEALFVGAAMVATSIGVTARVLGDMELLRTVEARVILGAAVIDDILGLLIIAVVGGLTDGTASVAGLGLLFGEAIGFVAFMAFIGVPLARRTGRHIGAARHQQEGPFALALLFCLAMAALSTKIGLAAIIGAFLAGMVLAETREQWDLDEQIQPIYRFLVPFFFVVMGAHVDVHALAQPSTLGLMLGVVALAVITKVIGCGGMALSLGKRSALFIGVGMVPRGEVGIIVASLGLRLGVLPVSLYGVLIAMSILTTLIAPPLLRALAPDRSLTALDLPYGDHDEEIVP